MSAIEGAGDAPDGGGGGSIHPSGTNATEEDGDVEPFLTDKYNLVVFGYSFSLIGFL